MAGLTAIESVTVQYDIRLTLRPGAKQWAASPFAGLDSHVEKWRELVSEFVEVLADAAIAALRAQHQEAAEMLPPGPLVRPKARGPERGERGMPPATIQATGGALRPSSNPRSAEEQDVVCREIRA